MATAATLAARLILDSSAYEKGLAQAKSATQKFESSLKTIGSNLSSLGRTATMMFTLPIVGGATLAGKAFIDLDTQMRNIQSITNQTDESLETLRQTFISMSTDLSVTRDSAEKLAEAFYFIQSSGFAGEDGMTVLNAATKAASAGLTDTMVAGNAILAVLNAYGLEAEDAAYVSDVLFKTVDLGVLSFEDLASQLGDIVSTSSTLNVGIDEIGAAMALLTRKGISSSEAVTALNQLMLQFISPSQKMLKAAKALGLNWDELNGILREEGLEATLEAITSVGGDDALLSIFGDNVRALKGALALAQGGTDAFEEMNAQFLDVAGRTQQAFEVQNKSVGAQLDNFKNKLTALGLTLAGVFIPILIELLDVIKPIVDWFAKADPTTQKWIVAILALVAIIGPVLIVLGGLATAISAIVAVIGAITLPILIVIVVIGLLIAALVWLYFAWQNNWYGIRDTMDLVILYIRIGIMAFMVWAENFFTGKLGGWSVIFTNALNLVKLAFDTFISNIRLWIQFFQALLNGEFYKAGAILRMIWDNNIRLLGQIIKIGLENIVAFFRMWWNSIYTFFTTTNWSSLGTNLMNGIYNGLVSAGKRVLDYVRWLANAVSQMWAGFWGIHSPSTLMEYYAAMMFKGWTNELGSHDWAMNTSANLPAATGALTQGGESNSNDPAVIELLRKIANKENNTDYVLQARALAQEIAKFI